MVVCGKFVLMFYLFVCIFMSVLVCVYGICRGSCLLLLSVLCSGMLLSVLAPFMYFTQTKTVQTVCASEIWMLIMVPHFPVVYFLMKAYSC